MTFRGFDNPIINREGRIAFWATLIGGGVNETNDQGIWSNASAVLALVARTGDQAPGAAPGVRFRRLQQLAFNSAGQTAFTALLTDIGAQPPILIGIWAERGGLAPVVIAGSQAPGLPNGVYIADLAGPALNGAGRTAFYAKLGGAGVNSTNNNAVYSEGGGTLAPVARAGSRAPGTPIGVNFASFYSTPVINDAGRTAFIATLTGLGVVPNVNDLGIWSEGGGSLALVARKGSRAPGTPLGVIFSGFAAFSVVINGAGRTAFQGFLTGPGVVEGVNDTGIWSEGGGNLVLVARAGSQVPGMPSGVTFSNLSSDVAMNSAGRVAFGAQMTGPGITYLQNSDGIWAETDSGLALIARGGDAIEVAPGDVRTIRQPFLLGGSGQEDGRRTGFNNAGDIAFVANFTNESFGVFTTAVDLPDRTCGTCGVGASALMLAAWPLFFATKRIRRRARR